MITFPRIIYFILLAGLIAVSPFVLSGLDWSAGWFIPVAFVLLTIMIALAIINFELLFLFFIVIMPAIYNYNAIKINVLQFFPIFNYTSLYINPISIFYLLIILFGLITIVEKWDLIKTLPLKYILLFSSLYGIASIAWSEYKDVSLIETAYLIVPFSMYLIAFSYFRDKSGFLKLVFASLLSSIIPIISALQQLYTGDFFYEPDSSLGRVYGTLAHPNTLGLYLFLIIGLLVSFYLAKEDKKIIHNKFIFSLGLASILIFVLTYSRTSWVSLAVFFCLYIFIEKKLIIFLAAAVPIAAYGAFVIENIRYRILEIFNNAIYSSVTSRLEIWKVSWNKILSNPSFGYGIGTSESVIDNAKTWEGGTSLPHNDYLLQILELGVVGLLTFFAYTFGAIYYAFKAFKNAADKFVNVNFFGRDMSLNFKTFSFGIFIILIAFLPATMLESLSQKIIIQIILWTLLGSLFSLKKKPA